MPPKLKAFLSWLRRWFIAVFTSAFFPAFVALIGVIAGLWSSLYTAELKDALPKLLSAGMYGEFKKEAIIGGELIVGFFFLFALHQTAKNMQEKDARRALLAETDKLKLLVERLETLPPDGFLQTFQALYQEVAYLPLLAWSEDTITKEDIEEAIRSVLAAIANLAHKFDGAPDREQYIANLMLCRTKSQLSNLTQAERDDLESRLIFCPELPTPKLNGVEAVLDLAPQLRSDYDDSDPNAVNTPLIVLPVPVKFEVDLGPEHGRQYTVLPGAPFVAAMHRYAAFESIRALLDWCRESADVTKATVNEISAFFHDGAGSDIKSFIAIPVCMTVDKEAPAPEVIGGLPKDVDNGVRREDCLAVLNIHSKSEDILGATGYGMFVPIIEPFIRVLALLLVSYGATLSTPLATDAILKNKVENQDDQKSNIS
ncbi:MAG: hypothetical protein JWQ21_2941 [Herminiimonas sp.]|nr:hypothetical protein [Herminiimonas sp.]